jgi:glutathione peroxidase
MIMKELLFSILIISSGFLATSIYDFTVTTMDDEDINLKTYSGKEVLFVVLPTTHTKSDTSFLFTLDSIYQNFADSLQIIGVPSYEDGYVDEDMDSLKTWYQSLLDSNIVISVAMHTRKSQGEIQHPLFAWLTNQTKNGHFNIDAQGARQVFFISKTGILHAIAKPSADLKLADMPGFFNIPQQE